MNRDRINYGETFCDAVDIIVSQKLKELEYDVTKVCTIIDNIYKDLGRYTVQEETIKYEAYSANKDFNIGDSVLVTIPNGNYNMQKMIISRVALDDDLKTSIAYESPMSQMLDFTGNISSNGEEIGLLANGGINENPDDYSSIQLIESISWIPGIDESYSDYTRMGVSVEFQTRLSQWKTTSGSYGLLFYFYDYNSTPEDRENRNSAYSFTFNTSDILGNPYDFQFYITQEKLFNISQLKNITQLDIYFYQNGDFKDIEGNLIPNSITVKNNVIDEFKTSTSADTNIQRLNDNIYIRNLHIQLGYGLNEFNGDELRISTNDSLEYSITNTTNNKNLILKWIHQKEDDSYELVNALNDNVELYWVRRGTTAQSIEYIVGKGWGQKNLILDSTNPFKCILDVDNGLSSDTEIEVKAVVRFKQSDGNWVVYNSNILVFNSIDPRVDEITYNAATKLAIACLDNSEGNYLLYGQNSKLINEGLGAGYLRTLRLRYKNIDIEKSEELKDNIASILWTVPINRNNDSFTMLNWDISEFNDSEIDYSEDGNYMIVTINNPSIYHLKYSIANVWYASNSHNTIQCKVYSKNGIIYETSRELFFGKANSQGTNFSLVLQYENDKNAYEVQTGNNNNIIAATDQTVKGLIYDLSGSLISGEGEWDWAIEGDEFELRESNGSTAVIRLKNNVSSLSQSSRDYYNILKVNYTEASKTVTAYLPISIKTLNADNEARSSTMEGAREVIYNSYGTPSYYTGAYILKDSSGEEIQNISWSINRDEDRENYPTLTALGNYWALLANPLFVKDYNYFTVVVAKNNNTVYWIQPILIMQSQYDFAITNEWNGESVLTDGNKIVAGIIAAGKKDTDNTFSGIILGDLDEQESPGAEPIVRTGLYGILKGINTFSLTDSGNANFHYSSTANNIERLTDINFGSDNHLGSSWDNGKQFYLDLDDQTLTGQTLNSGEILISNGAPYLKITDNNGIILQFTTGASYLQSSNFNSDNKTGLRMNLKTKKITGYEDTAFDWQGKININSGNFFELNTDGDDKIFRIGKLSVNKDGEVFYGEKNLSDYIK